MTAFGETDPFEVVDGTRRWSCEQLAETTAGVPMSKVPIEFNHGAVVFKCSTEGRDALAIEMPTTPAPTQKVFVAAIHAREVQVARLAAAMALS
jgi:hypothetical protein